MGRSSILPVKSAGRDTKVGKDRKIISVFKEVLLEPIILAFALYILFDRFRRAFNEANYPTASSRLGSIGMDIGSNLEIYIPLLILVLLWVILKAVSVARRGTEIRDLTKAINDLNKRLDDDKTTKCK